MFFKKKVNYKNGIIYNPVDGEYMKLEDVNDSVFSQKMMGDGFAIKPTSNKIYSPVNGKVLTIFPDQHALGLEAENGEEIIIHIGLETVYLKGNNFKTKVKIGDKVNVGDILSIVDFKSIKKQCIDTTVITVVPNIDQYESSIVPIRGNINNLFPIMKIKKKE